MGSKKSKQKPQELEQPPPPGPREESFVQQPQKRNFQEKKNKKMVKT